MLTVGSLIPKYAVIQNVTISHSKVIKPRQKTGIRLVQNDKHYTVSPHKGNLLDEAIRQGQELQYKCKKGTCGVCTIKIENGLDCLSLPNEKERKKLKGNLQTGYRLACQAEIL
jgi:ferredoxin, 2Fe-2S